MLSMGRRTGAPARWSRWVSSPCSADPCGRGPLSPGPKPLQAPLFGDRNAPHHQARRVRL